MRTMSTSLEDLSTELLISVFGLFNARRGARRFGLNERLHTGFSTTTCNQALPHPVQFLPHYPRNKLCLRSKTD